MTRHHLAVWLAHPVTGHVMVLTAGLAGGALLVLAAMPWLPDAIGSPLAGDRATAAEAVPAVLFLAGAPLYLAVASCLHKPRPAIHQVRRAAPPAAEHFARRGVGRAIMFEGCMVARPRLPAAGSGSRDRGAAAGCRLPGCVGNMLGRSPALNSRPGWACRGRSPGWLPCSPGRSRPGMICRPAGTHTPNDPPGAPVLAIDAAGAPGIHHPRSAS